MSLYHYIAENNFRGANELLKNYGFEQTSSLNTIIERLKLIVRKYKKTALRDLWGIHPDKGLWNTFTTSSFNDKDFAYATGRTPGFVDPVEETPEDSFEKTEEYVPPQSTLDTGKVVDEIHAVKKQIVKDKINRERRDMQNKLLSLNNVSMNQKQLLMIGAAFLLGYLIGKR